LALFYFRIWRCFTSVFGAVLFPYLALFYFRIWRHFTSIFGAVLLSYLALFYFRIWCCFTSVFAVFYQFVDLNKLLSDVENVGLASECGSVNDIQLEG